MELTAQAGEVLVVRHAETAWSLSGQHTGRTDLPLTERGREKAKQLAPLLSGLDFALVLASPLQRARDTCALAGLEGRMQIDADLMEWDYGDYEGMTSEEIHRSAPDWRIFRDGCPGGESPEQVAARVDRVIERVRAADGGVALFAHGHVLRILVARWIGLSPAHGSHFLLETCTLNVLAHYQGAPALRCWNVRVADEGRPA